MTAIVNRLFPLKGQWDAIRPSAASPSAPAGSPRRPRIRKQMCELIRCSGLCPPNKQQRINKEGDGEKKEVQML